MQHVLNHIVGNTDHPVVLEYRPERFLFGTKNYGEVRGGWYNRADGDPWDVFVPGYNCALPRRQPMEVADVLGVLMLENGNHKIAVRVPVSGYSTNRAKREIRTYVHRYTTELRKPGMWVGMQL